MKFYYPPVVRTFDGLGVMPGGDEGYARPGGGVPAPAAVAAPTAAQTQSFTAPAPQAAAAADRKSIKGGGRTIRIDATAAGTQARQQLWNAINSENGFVLPDKKPDEKKIRELAKYSASLLSPQDDFFFDMKEIVLPGTGRRVTITPGRLLAIRPDFKAWASRQVQAKLKFAEGEAEGAKEYKKRLDANPGLVATLKSVNTEDLTKLVLALVNGREVSLGTAGGGSLTLTQQQIKGSGPMIYAVLASRLGDKAFQAALDNALAGDTSFTIPQAPSAPAPAPSTRPTGVLSTDEGSGTTPPAMISADSANASWTSGPPAGKQGQASLVPPDIDPALATNLDKAKAAFEDALLAYTQQGTTSALAAVDRAEKVYADLLVEAQGVQAARAKYFSSIGRAKVAQDANADVASMQAELARIKARPKVSAQAGGTAAPQTTAAEQGQGMPSSLPPSSVPAYQYAAPSGPSVYGPSDAASGGAIEVPGLNVPQRQEAPKKGLSTGAWIGIGVGAAAAIGLGIWAAARRKRA